MYSVSFVQELCREINAEKDAERTEHLIALLQAVVKDDNEQIRIRMAFLAKKYSDYLREINVAD